MHIITILELRAAKLSSYIGRAYVLASVAQVFQIEPWPIAAGHPPLCHPVS